MSEGRLQRRGGGGGGGGISMGSAQGLLMRRFPPPMACCGSGMGWFSVLYGATARSICPARPPPSRPTPPAQREVAEPVAPPHAQKGEQPVLGLPEHQLLAVPDGQQAAVAAGAILIQRQPRLPRQKPAAGAKARAKPPAGYSLSIPHFLAAAKACARDSGLFCSQLA